MTDQTIDLTAGGVEYCLPRTITELAGKDISDDTITVSLGTYDEPGESWIDPVIDRPDVSTAVVRVLIGGDLQPDPGAYYLHVRVGDSPEVVQRRSPGRIMIR